MGLGSCLAAYTAGMSIGREDTAQFLATGVLVGTALSYLVRTLLGSTAVVKVDGILYAAAIGCAVVGFPTLNGFLPEDGFVRDVMMAGILSFMILLGSVVTWRDGTLLFQAIPSVALFGLVGCYDTYVYAPYLFFGFLVCLAIVLARANRREMMRQAVESGYFNRADAPSTPQEFPEQSAELYEDIRRGPWRWQAGPEWALASALIIVLLSRLGAPVIQEATRPLTSQFKILAPPSVRNLRGQYGPAAQQTTYVVGRGPNGGLTDHVVYQAKLDRPRYMRTAAYESYTGRGWATAIQIGNSQPGLVGESVKSSIASMGVNRRAVDFAVMASDPSRQLPLPAEPKKIGPGASVRPDGGGNLYDRSVGTFIQGTLVESTGAPTGVPHDLLAADRELLNVQLVPESVQRFAQDAVKGATAPDDKARRIAAAIAGQVKYNIEAAAVPSGADPAEWFLFTNREGYCDLFATAMTLCARSVGLPARYVIGYLPEKSDGQGNFVLREADYHAWCEVYFEGAGWTVYDATEGAEQVAGGERGSSDSNRPWYLASWVAPTMRGILIVFALGGGFLVLRSVRPKPRPPRWEVHRAYRTYERRLRGALERRRAAGETIEAYAQTSAGILGLEAVDLGRSFERALYGPAEPTEAEVQALRAGTKALRKR